MLFKKIEHVIPFLMAGRADSTIQLENTFRYRLKKRRDEKSDRPEDEKLVIHQVQSRNDVYLGYSDVNDEKNYPFKKDFVIKFDIEIFKMKRSGEYDQIVESFIGK
jgi:polar amino acid transport system substrate-binding protein